ncbi:MAG: hypothetical protein P4M12_09300 [Gammaproteobacteria bacterium]|nr:hypothetical protein [Gammaproteobacteria bacterium]
MFSGQFNYRKSNSCSDDSYLQECAEFIEHAKVLREGYSAQVINNALYHRNIQQVIYTCNDQIAKFNDCLADIRKLMQAENLHKDDLRKLNSLMRKVALEKDEYKNELKNLVEYSVQKDIEEKRNPWAQHISDVQSYLDNLNSKKIMTVGECLQALTNIEKKMQEMHETRVLLKNHNNPFEGNEDIYYPIYYRKFEELKLNILNSQEIIKDKLPPVKSFLDYSYAGYMKDMKHSLHYFNEVEAYLHTNNTPEAAANVNQHIPVLQVSEGLSCSALINKIHEIKSHLRRNVISSFHQFKSNLVTESLQNLNQYLSERDKKYRIRDSICAFFSDNTQKNKRHNYIEYELKPMLSCFRKINYFTDGILKINAINSALKKIIEKGIHDFSPRSSNENSLQFYLKRLQSQLKIIAHDEHTMIEFRNKEVMNDKRIASLPEIMHRRLSKI